MSHKILLALMAATAIVLPLMALASTRFAGTSLKDLMTGFSVLVLYSLILATFLMRIVLVLLGVFAVYQVLKERGDLGNSL